MIGRSIFVKGIVQGVGFRPFIYRIAKENNLVGDVKNTSKGVYINVQGKEDEVEKFIEDITDKAPILSRIDEVKVQKISLKKYEEFLIKDSEGMVEGMTLISPDIAVCEDCIEEVLDERNRRYKYIFTNCTNCGPRYTIINTIPYDRSNTTMKKFKMCICCRKEYYEPSDRRFHAEPTCCEKCGPKIRLLDNDGQEVVVEDVFKYLRELLKSGAIVAVKGIGGFNLVCDGRSKEVISKLRKRKQRPWKPLAVMMSNINEVENYCEINNIERDILKGCRKPIVLLKKINEELPENISFNNKNIGVLLPYSPLHYFLFDEELRILVFTSGNCSSNTIEFQNGKAVENLRNIADYFLVHDREITMPIDDSVVRVVLGKEQVIRSGRGYSPMYIGVKRRGEILACGAQLKNTFTVSVKDNAYVSPYIGDLETVEAQENFKRNLKHIINLYDLKLNMIAYDMHPNYWHQEFIKESEERKLEVFHHHAHIVSCLVDNGIKEKVIGIAFDGVGYGRDGNLWGGEFLICDYKDFKRVGHLKYMDMPGGDSATLNPWIMGISLVNMAFNGNKDKLMSSLPVSFKEKNINLILASIEYGKKRKLCSSMGRLFDGVASLLGFLDKVTYEGEAAVYLENLAISFKKKNMKKIESYVYKIKCIDGVFKIEINTMIEQILLDLEAERELGEIALRFHETILEFSKDMCERLRSKYKIDKVALSGGSFQNNLLLEGLYYQLSAAGFKVLTHNNIPCNDSGISVGQFFIANEIAEE